MSFVAYFSSEAPLRFQHVLFKEVIMASSRSIQSVGCGLVMLSSLSLVGVSAAQDSGDRRVEPVEGTAVETKDLSPERQQPEPPGKIDTEELSEQRRAQVAMDAGVGSPLAYASATVAELGGTLAFTHRSQTTLFRIAPSIGYFPIDNVELTLFPELSILDVSGNTDFQIGAMLEPSYHLPFSDRLYGFLGIGVGLRYADDPGADFALRPKLGMDILIGRSGIFKPAAFLDIGARDGLEQGGIEAGFTVML